MTFCKHESALGKHINSVSEMLCEYIASIKFELLSVPNRTSYLMVSVLIYIEIVS